MIIGVLLSVLGAVMSLFSLVLGSLEDSTKARMCLTAGVAVIIAGRFTQNSTILWGSDGCSLVLNRIESSTFTLEIMSLLVESPRADIQDHYCSCLHDIMMESFILDEIDPMSSVFLYEAFVASQELLFMPVTFWPV